MSELNEIITEQLAWFIGGIVIIVLFLLVTTMIQLSKLSKMRRRYDAMMSGNGVDNLESLLIDLKVQLDSMEDEQISQQKTLKGLSTQLRAVKGNVGIKRYNAFGERGNDLSFSMAIIDDNADGVVLTSIYNRENSYIYSKPLQAGESSISLSEEEKEVITLARQKS
ncbi:DUF4446 family protein [Paenibacillus sp. IHBB 10380]|uniref:DUF4446 family protein n=1 Tax=Paenibacillus sp. IHBB 10380 TaxID=1566358 RepID=UPI0005CFC342|nr:DUF4446 family protein [Paenibacillus sp. IHBB 10380]AJS60689.1 hypothetical protein UB51_22015 [Paenibacillus sp. IHBB 10380]